MGGRPGRKGGWERVGGQGFLEQKRAGNAGRGLGRQGKQGKGKGPERVGPQGRERGEQRREGWGDKQGATGMCSGGNGGRDRAGKEGWDEGVGRTSL